MAQCVTTSDCEGMQICLQRSKTCGCPITYGKIGAPDCDELSIEAAWAICTSALMLAAGLLVSLRSCIVLVRAVRRRQKGYLLSTTVASLLAGVTDVSLWANMLLHSTMPNYPSSTRAWELLVDTLSSLHASLIFLAAFSLSLTWVEFAITSKQLLRIGTNLRLTARFLLGFTLVFTAFSATCTILNSVFDLDVKLLWIIATYASCILLVAFLIVGSRRMSAVLAREAGRSLDVAKELTHSSMARPHLQLSERLRARGSNIVSTSSSIIICCLAYMFFSALYFIMRFLNAHMGVVWLLLGALALSTICVHVAIINCINTSMKIDAMHPAAGNSRQNVLPEVSLGGISVVSHDASLEVMLAGKGHSTATDFVAARLSKSPPPKCLPARSRAAPALAGIAADTEVQTADSARPAASVGGWTAARATTEAGRTEAEGTATATTSMTRAQQSCQTGSHSNSTASFRSSPAAPSGANRRPDERGQPSDERGQPNEDNRHVTFTEPASLATPLRQNQTPLDAFVYTRDVLSA